MAPSGDTALTSRRIGLRTSCTANLSSFWTSACPILWLAPGTQLGLFWIAPSWLAAGLYIAPAVYGYEPKGQKLLVNLLYAAVLLLVVGSLCGEWLGIKRYPGKYWFWFGTQGYECVDLGRFWQILLFVGLCLWLYLMWRALPNFFRRV